VSHKTVPLFYGL